MRGTVLDYHFAQGTGLIGGEDGNRYTFANADWRADAAPQPQQGVDFEVDGEMARAIYPQTPPGVAAPAGRAPGAPMPQSQKEGIIAIIGAATAWLIPVLGLVGAVVAVIWGVRAQRSAKIDGDKTGQGLGLAAVIVGAIGLVVAATTTIMALGFFATFGSMMNGL